jgi:hypothetical protein
VCLAARTCDLYAQGGNAAEADRYYQLGEELAGPSISVPLSTLDGPGQLLLVGKQSLWLCSASAALVANIARLLTGSA